MKIDFEKNTKPMMESEKIRKLVYDLYRYDWLMGRLAVGNKTYYTLPKIFQNIRSFCLENEEAGFEEWEEDSFEGTSYACFDKFLGAEYLDRKYIASLLEYKNPGAYKAYLADVDRMEQESLNDWCDVVLMEKPGADGLTSKEVLTLVKMLNGEECFPVEFDNPNGDSFAMGFISAEAAKKIDYNYEAHSKVAEHISGILGDMNKESANHIYAIDGLKVYISR